MGDEKDKTKVKDEAKAKINELVMVLMGCKKEIGDSWERFNNSLDRKDQAQAWVELVRLLHVCGSGLKICNDFLPSIKRNLQDRGIQVKSEKQIIEDDIPENIEVDEKSVESESKKKSFKKIIVIPNKQNIH